MKRDRQQRRFAIRRGFSGGPASESDIRAVEGLLAKIVAGALAADHPELFVPPSNEASGGSDER